MIQKLWVRYAIIGAAFLAAIIFLISARQILAPVFIALAIGYVGDPLIDRFEQWKISRTWGIVILVCLILLAMLGLGFYIVPQLLDQIEELAAKLPRYWEILRNRFLPQLETYAAEHPDQIQEYKNAALTWLKENAAVIAGSVSSGMAASFRSLGAFVSSLLSLVIIPVLAFYFLRDWDIIKGELAKLIPPNRRDSVVGLFRELDQALGNFIKGQLLVAVILSIIYSVGLTIAGCPASLLVGLVAGFANLVPYLGIALGFLPAVLLTYLSGNPLWQVIFAGLTFIIGQMLEGMVITPKIVGDSVGLHPVTVMIALILGGSYFGFVGMILALPVAAVLMVLLKRLYRYYVASPFFLDEAVGEGPPPAQARAAPAETPLAEPEPPEAPVAPPEKESPE